MNATCLSLASATLALSLVLLPACSGDDSTADGGVSNADATQPVDLGVVSVPDAGRPDAQPRPDAEPMDAATYCLENDAFEVEGTSVTVGDTTADPVNRLGEAASLSCRARRPSLNLGLSIRMEGCLSFIGATPTPAELEQLEVAVFFARNASGDPVDPTYDPATGRDREPDGRLSPQVVYDTASAACPSGVRLTLGRDSVGMNAFNSDIEYVVRTRSATTTAGQPLFVDQYNFGIIGRSDRLEGGSGEGCTPQQCAARLELTIARRAAFQALAGQTGANIPGLADLSDHVGSGHAMVQTHDCTDLTISNVASGFAPAPAARSYLTTDLGFGAGATVTSGSGVLLGVGFTGTTTVAPLTVTAGSAVTENGSCAEPFAGRTFTVYPDAISLVRLGLENTIR